MRLHFRNTILSAGVIFALLVGMTGMSLHAKQREVKKTNQLAILWRYENDVCSTIPLRIEDGVLYEYAAEDGTWTAFEMDQRCAQVFSGENLCVLMEDGSLLYDGLTEVPFEGENVPLTSAYGIMMAGKALEINETERFLSVNQNLGYLDFRALLSSGGLLCEISDEYECVSLPEEKPAALSGAFVLTEEGNVFYLNGDANKVYDGGDIISISGSETAARCVGLRANGEAVSWWMDLEAPDVSDWKDLVSVYQGFYFTVGVDLNGRVHYTDGNTACTAAVTEALRAWPDVTDAAVCSETVVGLTENGDCIFLNLETYREQFFGKI